MIPWWAGILLMFAGVFIGIVLIALMEASRQNDNDKEKRWWGE